LLAVGGYFVDMIRYNVALTNRNGLKYPCHQRWTGYTGISAMFDELLR